MKKLTLAALTGVVLAGCASVEPETHYVCTVKDQGQTIEMTILRDANNPNSIEAITQGDTIVLDRVAEADGNKYMDETGLLTLVDEGDRAIFSFIDEPVIDCTAASK